MKLVHKPLTRWIPVLCTIAALLAAVSGMTQQPEYTQHFDPAKGFKPAQTNLTDIFLQIAGSLEATGSPEGYIRHMQSEHKRIAALYEVRTGKPHKGRMPEHLTEDYINLTLKNWNTLTGPLQLNAFAREIGMCSREGIMGTRLTGTLAVEIFNEHQAKVARRMSGTTTENVGFTQLRDRLKRDLEFGKENVTMVGYEVTRRDAVSYAFVIDSKFRDLSAKIDSLAKPEKAALLKSTVSSMFLDLGYLAQSELELGILESALKQM